MLANYAESGLIVAGCAPKRQCKRKRVDLVALPESELTALVLGIPAEEMVFRTERNGPAIVRSLADSDRYLSIARRSGTNVCSMDATPLSADDARQCAKPLQVQICALPWSPAA